MVALSQVGSTCSAATWEWSLYYRNNPGSSCQMSLATDLQLMEFDDWSDWDDEPYTWVMASGSYTPGTGGAVLGNTTVVIVISGASCTVSLDSFSLMAA